VTYQRAPWNTGHEKRFLSAAVRTRLPKDAILFLRDYLAAAELRRDWNGLSPRVIKRHAAELLAGLRSAA
jgi:hypothetical protein